MQVHTGEEHRRRSSDGDGRSPRKLRFADGSTLATDMVVFSAGIRPRDELARGCWPRGGRTRRHRRRRVTAAPPIRDIYAIGECALSGGKIYGLVAPGYQMAAWRGAADRAADSAMPALRRTGATRALHRRRHEHQAQADGRGRGARSATRMAPRPARAAASFVDERRRRLQEAGGQRRRHAAARRRSWSATPTDYGSLLQMMLNSLPLPESRRS